MVISKKAISVDEKFFYNIFEEERKKMQEKLGVINLSQYNFTKMIRGLKMMKLKNNNFKTKLKIKGRKGDDFFKI